MDKKLQDYYENMFSMMLSKGWKDFIEDLETLKTTCKDITTVKDANMLQYRLGQLDILDLILGRKSISEKVYEELLNEANI